jgi:DNA polymerase-4
MVSEFNKPNGISLVFEDDLTSKIWPLACRKINGIGPKADEKLKGLGIQTIGQLAQQELQWLIDHFGQKTGAWMHDAAHGRDTRPIVLESEPVSISRETSFERDLHAVRDKAELGAIFTRLCEQLAQDLARKGYVGKTIGIKLRFDDFRSLTRDLTLDAATGDARAIRQAAGLCLKRAPLTQRLRLLGVRVASLSRPDTHLDHKENDPPADESISKDATYSEAKNGQLF